MESPQAAWRAAVTLALSSLGAAGGAAAQTVPAPVVDPAWLKADTATRTAGFELIAGLTGLNGALNFNGFRDGGLTLTVPKGWTVAVHFRNHDGMLPHSAEVIADVHPLPLQPQPSAFDRAFTLKLAEGLAREATDDFRLIANREGSVLLFCGGAGDGAAGARVRRSVAGCVRRRSQAEDPAGKAAG